MKKHESKFDSHGTKALRNEVAGLPRDAGLSEKSVSKVRSGRVNESKEAFSEETLQKLQQKWNELIKPVTGFDSYEAMRASVNSELGRSFS